MPRKYIKTSEYWNQFKKNVPNNNLQELFSNNDSVEPKLCGESFYSSSASYSRSQPSSGSSGITRSNKIHKNKTKNRYKNIQDGILPFEANTSGVSIRQSIELCQKAYCNVAIFRNAIDVMAEFANSTIYLKGGTAPAREFISKWMDRIKIWSLKDQYFREYYRSGNVFFYRIDGKFQKEDFKKISSIYGSEGGLPLGKIPIRYILLNPYDIIATKTTAFEDGDYKKILSEYELDRLRNPKTKEDKELFDNLPAEVKKQIKNKAFFSDGIFVNLEPEKLSYSFYKKQDYEPFAVPFGFSVLDDINWKLELKKIDQAISRTVENVILMITMGAKPDDGGINPNNLNAMQQLFQNESVGRVLVSDYTTKADFIIPDINKVLGPDKYKVVNEDIRDALQNIIVGQEKYANTQVKAQIFLERLKEARNAFLNDFLQPQIKILCRAMGFRKFPVANFENIDIKDEVQLQRVATRLIELGVLPAEQGLRTIQTGVYPTPEELEISQKKYVEQREDGMYNPLVGGVPTVEPAGAEEDRILQEKNQKAAIAERKKLAQQQKQQTNVPNETGRPSGANASYSRKDIQGTVYEIEKLRNSLASELRKFHKIKKMNQNQTNTLDSLVESLIVSEDKSNWSSVGIACVRDFNKIGELTQNNEIIEISESHQLPVYPAAILYHSKKVEDSNNSV
jgi:hypothetical protein